MLSLIHLIYMAGDKCMRQNACYFYLKYTRKPQRAPAGGYISTVSCHSYFDRRGVHTRSFQ